MKVLIYSETINRPGKKEKGNLERTSQHRFTCKMSVKMMVCECEAVDKTNNAIVTNFIVSSYSWLQIKLNKFVADSGWSENAKVCKEQSKVSWRSVVDHWMFSC